MVLYSSSAEMSTMCSKECRENMMKFSKDRSATWMIEKKSVGEKDHVISQGGHGKRTCERSNEFELW